MNQHQFKYFSNTKRWQQLGFVLIAGIIYLENGFCVLRFSLTDCLISILVRKSLDLIESLLRLAEVGQYEQVKQLFSFPIKHCPDMLVLALLQINTSWHTLRHELISTLMPIFLGNHPNSAIILHYAWHGQVRYDHFFVLIINIKMFFVDLCFGCTAKWVSHVHIFTLLDSVPIHAVTGYWVECPVLFSRFFFSYLFCT